MSQIEIQVGLTPVDLRALAGDIYGPILVQNVGPNPIRLRYRTKKAMLLLPYDSIQFESDLLIVHTD